jgi:hypothetical protein
MRIGDVLVKMGNPNDGELKRLKKITNPFLNVLCPPSFEKGYIMTLFPESVTNVDGAYWSSSLLKFLPRGNSPLHVAHSSYCSLFEGSLTLM